MHYNVHKNSSCEPSSKPSMLVPSKKPSANPTLGKSNHLDLIFIISVFLFTSLFLLVKSDCCSIPLHCIHFLSRTSFICFQSHPPSPPSRRLSSSLLHQPLVPQKSHRMFRHSPHHIYPHLNHPAYHLTHLLQFQVLPYQQQRPQHMYASPFPPKVSLVFSFFCYSIKTVNNIYLILYFIVFSNQHHDQQSDLCLFNKTSWE